VNGFAVYNSFADLVIGNVAQTISSVNYSAGDLYIAVPAPGAIALMGVVGLIGARRRK
jgi:xanthosine utilization system XapX-like protein